MGAGFFHKYRQDKGGNVAIMFSVAGLAILGMVGLAIDVASAQNLKSQLQDTTDMAALAGATAALNDPDNRASNAIESSIANLADDHGFTMIGAPVIEFDDTANTVSVELAARMNLWFVGLLDQDKMNIKSKSTVAFGPGMTEPTSIVFVLDVSGSMDTGMSGSTRINVLKDTLEAFFDELDSREGTEPELPNHIRTGLLAYNLDVQPQFTVPLDYGWADTATMVSNLTLGLGTIPADSMEQGYQMLIDGRTAPGGNGRREIIVYMTDGEIDDHLAPAGVNYTQDTLDTCQAAKDDGIEIFSIGMGAPVSAVDVLRQCASPDGSQQIYSAIYQAVDDNCAADTASCEAAKSIYFENATNTVQFAAYIDQITPIQSEASIRIIK